MQTKPHATVTQSSSSSASSHHHHHIIPTNRTA